MACVHVSRNVPAIHIDFYLCNLFSSGSLGLGLQQPLWCGIVLCEASCNRLRLSLQLLRMLNPQILQPPARPVAIAASTTPPSSQQTPHNAAAMPVSFAAA